MFDFFRIYLGYLKNSRKIIFVSLIGLTCALALISSSLLYIDSAKVDISNSIIQSSNASSPYDVSVNYAIDYPYVNTTGLKKDINDLAQNISSNLGIPIFSPLNLTYWLTNFYTPQKSNPQDFTHPLINNSVIVVELSPELRSELRNFLSVNSALPEHNQHLQQAFALQSDLIVSNSPIIDFYRNNDLINKSLTTFYLGTGIKTQTFHLNVTGVGKLITPYTYNSQTNTQSIGTQLEKYPILSGLILHNDPIETYLFVNNLTRFVSTIKFDKLNLPLFAAYGGFKINYKIIDVLALASKNSDISQFCSTLTNKIVNSYYVKNFERFLPNIKVLFLTSNIYNSITSTVNKILYYLFIYTFPIVIIAIFMTTYSFGLIYKKQLKNVSIYKIRGLSTTQLLKIGIYDLLLLAVLSWVLAIILGFPIITVVKHLNLNFGFNSLKTGDIALIFINNVQTITEVLFTISILLSITVNILKIIKLSRMSVVETDNIYAVEKEPVWKKYYLDIVFFLYGAVSYGILIFLLSNPEYEKELSNAIFIILSLTTPSPFIFGLGLILVVNRILPVILNWIGTKLWILKGDLLAFSLKDFTKHNQTSTRAIILIASLVAFVMLFYTVPYSQIQYEQQVSLFENGAEGVLTLTNFPNNLTIIHEIINEVSNTLQIHFNDSIQAYSPFYTALVYDNGISNQQLIFINSSNFLQASAINQFHTGLKNSLSKDLKTLQEINNSILINEQGSKANGVSINQNLYLAVTNHRNQEFPVIDTFAEWPGTASYNYDNNLYCILDMNAFLNSKTNTFEGTYLSQISNFGFYLKFKNGVNKTAVAEKLANQYNYQVKLSNYNPSDWTVSDALVLQFQISQIDINLLLSMSMILIILVLFSYMQLNEKKHELLTLRVLGANFTQISSLFLLELSILIISGIILGTIIGNILIDLLTVFMTQGRQIPPYIVLIPWNIVLATFIVFIVVSAIVAFLTSYILIKKDISDNLLYL